MDSAGGTAHGWRRDRRCAQSAAAPSPFPPIADYAFLSDCHTGALVAPDGAIGWLCVPRFDSPSVFGTLLDRQAGYFRLGPYGINHATARAYEPGTNVMTTTWKTPSGWILVRDALTLGPRDGEDEITPHTRPPADDDADHMLVRTVRCLDGNVEVELVCEPVFDYGRTPAEWTMVESERHVADASGAGQSIRLRTDLALGIEGNRVRARHVLSAGDECYCALSWAEGLVAPAEVGRGGSTPGHHRPVLAGMAGSGAGYRTTAGATRCNARPWPSRASPTCRPARPSLRSPPRCRRRPEVNETGTTDTAGCGTPLHAAGPALPAAGLGSRRVHPVRRRPRAEP